jgi:hypothetical protein
MKRALLAALLWSLPGGVLHGAGFSSQAVGTAGSSFLRIGSGARAAAMGGAYSAVADDAGAVYWNPAGLALLQGRSLQLSHSGDQDGVNLENVAFGAQAGRLGFGGALSYRDVGSIDRTDANGDSQGVYRPRDYAATVSLATDLHFASLPEGALAAGVSGKVFKSKIVEEANGYAFDAGLLGRKELGEDWVVRAAAVAQNLGVRVKFDQESDPLPTTFRLGLALLSRPHWLVSGEAFLPRSNGLQGGLGVEFVGQPFKGIRGSLRCGANTLTLSDVSPLSALSMGAGLSFGMISLDYAVGMVGDASQMHRVTLGFRFGTRAAPATAGEPPANEMDSPFGATQQIVQRPLGPWIY